MLCVIDLRCDLHGEVGLVFAGKHAVGHLVEDLCDFRRVILTDGEDDGFADLAADWVSERIFEEGFAEKLVGSGGKEFPLEVPLRIACGTVFPVIIFDFDDEALVREQLRGDVRPGINNRWIDEVAILHTIEQGVVEGGLAVFATEGSVGI